jgi:hypothetical protein
MKQAIDNIKQLTGPGQSPSLPSMYKAFAKADKQKAFLMKRLIDSQTKLQSTSSYK